MNLISSDPLELGVGADNRRCVVTEAGDEDFSLAHRAGTVVVAAAEAAMVVVVAMVAGTRALQFHLKIRF